jgi:hypothetical protein
MTPRRVASAVLLLSTLIAAAPAAAQEACKATETVNACRIRVRSELRGDVVQTEASSDAKKTETGLVDLANGLSSSMKDFLPLFQLSGLLGPTTTDEKTGTVSVAFNRPTAPGDVQLRAIIETKPAVFPALKDVATTAQAAALDKAVASGKNQTNVTGEVAFNLVSERLGRDYRQYQPMLNKLFAATTSAAADAVVTGTQTQRAALDAELRATPRINAEDDLLGSLPPDRRAKVSDLIVTLETAFTTLAKEYRTAAEKAGAGLFGQLINNQPQLHTSFAYARRDAFLGPDRVVNFKVTYELPHGGRNLNAFVDYAIKLGCDPRVDANACAARFRDFVQINRRQIEGGMRWAYSFELERRMRDYQPTLPDGTSPYGLRKGYNFAGSIDIGGVIGADTDGKASGRWDISGRFETRDPIKLPADPDEKRLRRSVISATLTKKVGDLSIPFGLVWANRSEYLTKDAGNDYPVSAHVGLKFNLFPLK